MSNRPIIGVTVGTPINPDKMGGTSDYSQLKNKPTINGTEIVGDLSFEDLGIDTNNFPIYAKATINEDRDGFDLTNIHFPAIKSFYDAGYTVKLVAETLFLDSPFRACADIIYIDDEQIFFEQTVYSGEFECVIAYTFIVYSEGKHEYFEREVTVPTDYVTTDMLVQAIQNYDNDVMSLLGSDEE